MKRYVVTFLLAAISACASIPTPITQRDELSERAAIRSEVVTLIGGEQFSKLEALAARYRMSQSRTSNGIWQLTLFYSGVASAFDSDRKEQDFWLKAERSAKKWVADYPNSATAHLSYAKMLLSHGWSFRGSGYANTVEPQNWKPFEGYVQQARVYLEKNKRVASNDPHWYELMAVVACAQGWPESDFSKLISEGLQREPLFYQTYFAAIDYYAPKWGGSAVAIEQFAREGLEQTRSTEGFAMYARIYWYASQTQFYDRLFSESLVDWTTMKKGIDDVLNKYPDSWNINNFAKFACLSKDKAKTAELMGRITDAPLGAVWGSSFFQQCKVWAFN
jgi:hypothetical protein